MRVRVSDSIIDVKHDDVIIHVKRRPGTPPIATAVGVTRQTITSIETGKYVASLPLAYKIARYFGYAIEDVFDFTDLEESK
ncbi:DNA-binding protein [Actinobaculum suis]|uniref:DNA-binding protein n=1 Tax=Actinobaculum suis TaxID=1657 RepID=A0A7Z9C896_9ACTO|nr:helix-turn-helix transcriptional regulator [Actinobaculum suis]VDG76203.1 DNA-binding protein [Actinobaculum suis]